MSNVQGLSPAALGQGRLQPRASGGPARNPPGKARAGGAPRRPKRQRTVSWAIYWPSMMNIMTMP